MPELIAFRALQGLGGGGLMSVTVVVLGHLRAENPRAAGGGRGNAAARMDDLTDAEAVLASLLPPEVVLPQMTSVRAHCGSMPT